MVAPLVSHRDFASLHPTGDHVERAERVAVLLEAFAEFEEPRRATQQELALCHDPDYIRKIQAVSESGRTVMLDADTVCTPSTYETARLAAGGAIAVAENGGFAAVHFGENGDVPVRGDFEGDGKADYAVFRPTTGMWYILHSSGIGFRAVHFGVNGDVPVAGNYDADRQADIAVFRPSTGMWYILRSAEGAFQQAHFGVEGDIPAVAR